MIGYDGETDALQALAKHLFEQFFVKFVFVEYKCLHVLMECKDKIFAHHWSVTQ